MPNPYKTLLDALKAGIPTTPQGWMGAVPYGDTHSYTILRARENVAQALEGNPEFQKLIRAPDPEEEAAKRRGAALAEKAKADAEIRQAIAAAKRKAEFSYNPVFDSLMSMPAVKRGRLNTLLQELRPALEENPEALRGNRVRRKYNEAMKIMEDFDVPPSILRTGMPNPEDVKTYATAKNDALGLGTTAAAAGAPAPERIPEDWESVHTFRTRGSRGSRRSDASRRSGAGSRRVRFEESPEAAAAEAPPPEDYPEEGAPAAAVGGIGDPSGMAAGAAGGDAPETTLADEFARLGLPLPEGVDPELAASPYRPAPRGAPPEGDEETLLSEEGGMPGVMRGPVVPPEGYGTDDESLGAVGDRVRRQMGQSRALSLELPPSQKTDFERLKRMAGEKGITPEMIQGLSIPSPTQRTLVQEIKRMSKYLNISPQVFSNAYTDMSVKPITEEEFTKRGRTAQGLPQSLMGRRREPAKPQFKNVRAHSGTLTAGDFKDQPKYISEAGKYLIERGLEESQDPYIPYPGEKIAPLSDEQLIAGDLIKRQATKPQHQQQMDEARGTAHDLSNFDSLQELEPDIERASRPAPQGVEDYMNPYQEHAIDRMYSRGYENFKNRVLEPLENRLIAKGMHYGTHRPKMMGKALDEFGEHLADKEAQMRQMGFDRAVQSSQADLGRRMQGASLKGTTRARNVQQRLDASKQMQQGILSEQEQKMREADLLRMMGTEKYNIAQAERNSKLTDWEAQKNHRRSQTAMLADLVRGIPANTARFQVSNQVPMQQVVPSGLQQGAGMMQGVGSMLAGGRMAEGGSVQPLSSQELAQQHQQAMENMAGKVEASKGSPFWDFMAQMGFNMAGNPNPNTMMALGQSAKEAYPAFRQTRQANSEADIQAANIRRKLLESQMTFLKSDRDEGRKDKKLGMDEKLVEAKLAALNAKGEAPSPMELAQLKAEGKHNVSSYDKQAAAYDTNQQKLKILEQMKKLNQHNVTGIWEGWTGGKWSKSRAGSEMFNKYANELANLKARELGGRGGSKVIDQMRQSGPNLGLSAQANAQIIDAMIKETKNQLNKTGRNLTGSDYAFQKFMRENPEEARAMIREKIRQKTKATKSPEMKAVQNPDIDGSQVPQINIG